MINLCPQFSSLLPCDKHSHASNAKGADSRMQHSRKFYGFSAGTSSEFANKLALRIQ
jgi:hypothetical protein